MSEVEYQKHYYPGTRDELVARLREQLSDFRFEHVVRVEHTAVKLASRYGIDAEKASVAGWFTTTLRNVAMSSLKR